ARGSVWCSRHAARWCQISIAADRLVDREWPLPCWREQRAPLVRDPPPFCKRGCWPARAAEQAADGCADAVDQDLDRAQSVLASAQAKPEGFFLGWSTERLAGYRGCCAVLLNA